MHQNFFGHFVQLDTGSLTVDVRASCLINEREYASSLIDVNT